MNIRNYLSKATRTVGGLALISLAGCDTAPAVVSFNTPELCEPELTNIATFTQAREGCDDGCQICIATSYQAHALTYAISRDDNCVCPAPSVIQGIPADAGANPGETHLDATHADADLDADTKASSDAFPSTTTSDAGATPGAPNVAADGCSSLLNLSQSAAAAYCEDKTDCHVCVERVDFDNDPRRYMAHQCACPSPHRIE